MHFSSTFKSLGRVVSTLFYATMRRFFRLFDGSARTRGNYHQIEIGLLESPSPTKGEICQRDISPPKGRRGVRYRYRATDRSPGTDNDTPISRRSTLRRSPRAPSPRLERGRERHRSFQDCQPCFLDERLGHLRLPELDRECLIKSGKARALEGAGPVTVGIDLGYIKTILSHAAAVHGVVVSTQPIDLARIALGRLGLVGKGDERDRRPTQNELDRIIWALESNIRQQIPVGRIIGFAVATAMRQDEIARG